MKLALPLRPQHWMARSPKGTPLAYAVPCQGHPQRQQLLRHRQQLQLRCPNRACHYHCDYTQATSACSQPHQRWRTRTSSLVTISRRCRCVAKPSLPTNVCPILECSPLPTGSVLQGPQLCFLFGFSGVYPPRHPELGLQLFMLGKLEWFAPVIGMISCRFYSVSASIGAFSAAS